MHFDLVGPRYSMITLSTHGADRPSIKDGYAPGSTHLVEVITRTASLVAAAARLKRRPPPATLVGDVWSIIIRLSAERASLEQPVKAPPSALEQCKRQLAHPHSDRLAEAASLRPICPRWGRTVATCDFAQVRRAHAKSARARVHIPAV